MRALAKPHLPAAARAAALWLAAGWLAAAPAAAAERTLTLDPEATRIRFTLGATLHTVEGTARLSRGEVRFDPETGAVSGRLVVDATSADTGNEKRDRDMHDEVLESERFPEIVFAPSEMAGDFDPDGESRLTLSGTLEIHGTSHPLTLEVTATAEGRRLTAATSFAVPYVEWGMKDPSKFILRVDKEVEVTVEAVGELLP